MRKSELIERGDIYYVSQDGNRLAGAEMWANRPAVIVSNQVINRKLEVVEIVYLTTSPSFLGGNPLHPGVNTEEGKACAVCEQITTVDKQRLVRKLGRLSDKDMKKVAGAIKLSLELNDNVDDIYKDWSERMDEFGYNPTIKKQKNKELKKLQKQIEGMRRLLDFRAKRIDELEAELGISE